MFRGRPLVSVTDGGRTTHEPAWTESDRWLALALTVHEGSLCPGGCGQPRDRAWHPDSEGWYDPEEYVCAACTALREHDGEAKDVKYAAVVDTRPADNPLPPWPVKDEGDEG